MSVYETRAIPLSMVQAKLIPTKKLKDPKLVDDARKLVLRRAQLPHVVVVRHPGSERYLILFGHNAVAGALMAYAQNHALGDYEVHLREVLALDDMDGTADCEEFAAMLLGKASRCGYIDAAGEVRWDMFKQEARSLLDRAARKDTERRPEVPVEEGAFSEGTSESIDLEIVRRIRQIKEEAEKAEEEEGQQLGR